MNCWLETKFLDTNDPAQIMLQHSRGVKIHMIWTGSSEGRTEAKTIRRTAVRGNSSLRHSKICHWNGSPRCWHHGFRTDDSHHILWRICARSPVCGTARSYRGYRLLILLWGLGTEALDLWSCHHEMRSFRRRVTTPTSLPYFSISVCKVLDVCLFIKVGCGQTFTKSKPTWTNVMVLTKELKTPPTKRKMLNDPIHVFRLFCWTINRFLSYYYVSVDVRMDDMPISAAPYSSFYAH